MGLEEKLLSSAVTEIQIFKAIEKEKYLKFLNFIKFI